MDKNPCPSIDSAFEWDGGMIDGKVIGALELDDPVCEGWIIVGWWG